MTLRVLLPSQYYRSGDVERCFVPACFPEQHFRQSFYHPYQLMSASRFMEDAMGLFDDAAPLFWIKKPSKPQKGETPPEKPTDFSSEFELAGFDPSEVKVKTIGQKVIVEATKEVKDEKDGCRSYTRKEYHRSIVLPDNVNTEELTSTLNEAGKLRITAPLIPSLENKEEEKEVPVQKEEKNDDAVKEAPASIEHETEENE